MTFNVGFTKPNINWLGKLRQSAGFPNQASLHRWASSCPFPSCLYHGVSHMILGLQAWTVVHSWRSHVRAARTSTWRVGVPAKRPHMTIVWSCERRALAPMAILRSWDARLIRYPPKRAMSVEKSWSRRDSVWAEERIAVTGTFGDRTVCSVPLFLRGV